MKRYLLILIFVSLCAGIHAQDYFSETAAKAKRATPHEAAYIWSEYQQFLPTFHATYFHLGNIYYDLIPTEHPIRDYEELTQYLYRTKLYYGNCLHYAKDQTLKPIHYEGLPYTGKRPEYADLQQIIKQRLDFVNQTSQTAKALYDSYNQLVNRYNLCRIVFSSFSEKYGREKMAHLHLSDQDKQQLLYLQTQADSLQHDIQSLQQALNDFPVKDYHPNFLFESINLYRLDGLTSINILQNEVVLWDYSSWAKDFLYAQDHTYRDYFAAIDNEYNAMRHAIAHPNAKIRINDILLNRINRMDYQSPLIDSIALLQQAALIKSIEQSPTFKQDKADDEYIEQNLTLLFNQQKAYTQLQYHYAQLHYQDSTYLHLADSSCTITATTFAAHIRPTAKSITSYTNDISGETFGIHDMHFALEDSVITIIPVDTNYLVVLPHQTILSSLSGEMLLKTRIESDAPFFTAYKYSNHIVALVSERQVLFIDTDSQHK